MATEGHVAFFPWCVKFRSHMAAHRLACPLVVYRDGGTFVAQTDDQMNQSVSTSGGFTMAKAKTGEKAATAADRSSKSPARPATVTTDDIAHRAYDLYLARGRKDGHDVEDWMQAERERRTGSAAA